MKSLFIHSKKTKIIATLGPASLDKKILKNMFLNGVDLIRFNASHQADFEVIKDQVKMVRSVAKQVDKAIGIFLDLQGPKIRVGKFESPIELTSGDRVRLTTDTVLGTAKRFSVGYQGFVEDVQVGDPLFIDDGRIRLLAVDKDKDQNNLICEVIKGGTVSNHKGVNLPKTNTRLSAMTEKDFKDVLTAIKCKFDFVALSFVSRESDVLELRKFLTENGGSRIKIISKIERQIAIENILSIIEVSDALMVARGDLGVEIGIENVPRAQKMIIRRSNRRLKPVIVATQMLESMISSSIATRAEVSDVANAIYDHCDAIMLSGETAVGIDPLNVARTMSEIAVAADSHMNEIREEDGLTITFHEITRPISFCKAADQIAVEHNADAIMAFTSSGNTPTIASKFNSKPMIIAPTDDDIVYRQMSLLRGVVPIMMPKEFSEIHRWTDMIRLAIKEAKTRGLIKSGNTIVVTAGIPIGQSHGINSIRIVTVK